MLSEGFVISDRYMLDGRVATGGMGEVWHGFDVLLGREVAVKVLLPSLVSDPEFVTRFRAEARMMAALRHPGIVQVHDFGETVVPGTGRVSYLVMEYVDGEPLSKRIQRTGRLGVPESMSIVAQAAEALQAAHSAGIVHRDVKPGNLLVQRDGNVVLVDFGIARSAAMANITATSTVLGTASYLSPEQASGQSVSWASDIYALGVVTYFCLAGRPPFTGDNPIQVALQHVQDQPPALPAEIPAPVAALVFRALAKNPAERFRSAADFAATARAVGGATPTGPTAPVPVPTAPPPAAPSGPPPAGQWGTGPTVPQPYPPSPAGQVAGSVPPAAGGNRRRRGVLAGVLGGVLVALTGLVAAVVLRPGDDGHHLADQSSTLPPTATTGLPDQQSSAGVGGGRLTDESGGTSPAPASPSRSGKPARSASANPAPAGSTSAPGSTTGGTPAPTTSTTKSEMPNPYTPTQVCGSGYQVIDSATLTANGVRQGRVYLLFNSGNGYNCVVTLKDTSVGTPTSVTAYLEVEGSTRKRDGGSYAYYAGPVRAAAQHVCVKWGGSTGGASYGSPFEHCD